MAPGVKRERCSSLNSLDVEVRPKKKMSKFDSLKPISNYLETLLVSNGLSQHRADMVAIDILERFVTAGFGWDKMLQYHAKVREKVVLITVFPLVITMMIIGRGHVQKEVDPSCFHVKGRFPPNYYAQYSFG